MYECSSKWWPTLIRNRQATWQCGQLTSHASISQFVAVKSLTISYRGDYYHFDRLWALIAFRFIHGWPKEQDALMIRVLALYQNGQSTFNICRAPFDLPSREEAGDSTQDYPRSRSNSKSSPHSECHFGSETYAAIDIQARLQACLPLFAVTLGHLAVNYTSCRAVTSAAPFVYITYWYEFWWLFLNDE